MMGRREEVLKFSFHKNGHSSPHFEFEAKLFVPLPETTSVAEQFSRLCSTERVPCYAYADLERQLKEFIESRTTAFYKEKADEAIEMFRVLSDEEAGAVIDKMTSNFSQVKSYVPSRTVCREETFFHVYQSLLHSCDSSNIQKILLKEQELRAEVQKIVRERNWEIERLRKEHRAVVEKAAKDSSNGMGDHGIAVNAFKHFEKIHQVEAIYASQLSSLMESQKKEFQHFVLSLHEENALRDGKEKMENIESSPEKREIRRRRHTESISSRKHREESFTIYLGAQMKTMHNLRLAAINPVDLCWRKFSATSVEDSCRLQMALSLYSSQLSAVVLLVDSRPAYHLNFQTDFLKACEQSTELHFANLESQLQEVEQEVVRGNDCRLHRNRSLTGCSGVENTVNNGQTVTSDNLNTGDVYVTRHSNLSHVHTVFHMVADDALKSQDISSRHPCINGLRNVIRLSSKFGVTTISLPLLLVDKLTEDLTVSWCLRRAELVFKCVKGFLMEGAALGGTSSGNFGSGHQLFYNVQFLVPPEISNEMFSQITEMLPTIYHLVNPVMENA